MFVPMELARIIISELNDQQVIYLREVDGERMFPILIGLFEATSIDRRIKKEYPQRPLTHDLLKATIEAPVVRLRVWSSAICASTPISPKFELIAMAI